MRLIDAQFLEAPSYGSRQMTRHRRWEGHETGSELRAGLSRWIGDHNTRRPDDNQDQA